MWGQNAEKPKWTTSKTTWEQMSQFYLCFTKNHFCRLPQISPSPAHFIHLAFFKLQRIKLWTDYYEPKSGQNNLQDPSMVLAGRWHTPWMVIIPHLYKYCFRMLAFPFHISLLKTFLPGKMNSKAFIFLSLLLAAFLLISSTVSAETSLDEKNG